MLCPSCSVSFCTPFFLLRPAAMRPREPSTPPTRNGRRERRTKRARADVATSRAKPEGWARTGQPKQSARSGLPCAAVRAGESQRPPSRVGARARCKAALSSAHHLRRQPASAARPTAGGARSAVSQARTTSRCGPGRQSSGYRASLRRRATAMAVPSSGRAWLRSAVATERSNERGVAAQRFAQARGAVTNKILRFDAWRRSVGQPLLRDNPALGPQTFTRNAGPRLFKQGGAAGQQSAARARCRMDAQDIERSAAPREPIAFAIPVREGQREAQALAQGDVHVRRGQRGARVSRHSRKPKVPDCERRQARSLGRMCGRSSASRK